MKFENIQNSGKLGIEYSQKMGMEIKVSKRFFKQTNS